MAAHAYVLITAELERAEGVFRQLNTIPGALTYEVLGPDNVVIDVESDTPEDITAIVRHKIRPIHGVTKAVMVEGPI